MDWPCASIAIGDTHRQSHSVTVLCPCASTSQGEQLPSELHDAFAAEIAVLTPDRCAGSVSARDAWTAAELISALDQCSAVPGRLRALAAKLRLQMQAAELVDLRARLSTVEEQVRILISAAAASNSPYQLQQIESEATGQGEPPLSLTPILVTFAVAPLLPEKLSIAAVALVPSRAQCIF